MKCKRVSILCSGLLLLLSCVGCGRADRAEAGAAPLRVYAAASLTNVLQALGTAFEAQTGHAVEFNFAGSNTLAQQLIAAPRADVFFSASEQWMDRVAEAGLIIPETRRTVLSNRLVVIAHPQSRFEITGIEALARLPFTLMALGNPDAVPAGRYARAWLQSIEFEDTNLWTHFAGRISPTADVRAALAQVQSQRDFIGIVYASDVASAPDSVRILLSIPVPSQAQPRSEFPPGPKIAFPIAVLQSARAPEVAAQWIAFMQSATAAAEFTAAGFTVLATAQP